MVSQRPAQRGKYLEDEVLGDLGLSVQDLSKALSYVYSVVDELDKTLLSKGEVRLAKLIELANLSAVIGNLFRGGVSRASEGRFVANAPHKYPDLVSTDPRFESIEIKVALEGNKPKGHLVKPGPHLTVRYILGTEEGKYLPGKDQRGDVVWIWEIRAGHLTTEHFNLSNTEGDSGKTAVVNKEGMAALKVVYLDLDRCPLSSLRTA